MPNSLALENRLVAESVRVCEDAAKVEEVLGVIEPGGILTAVGDGKVDAALVGMARLGSTLVPTVDAGLGDRVSWEANTALTSSVAELVIDRNTSATVSVVSGGARDKAVS